MKNRWVYRSSCAIAAFVFILTITGCANNPPTAIEASPSAAPEVPSPEPSPVASPQPKATAVPVSEPSDPDILYQDNFTDPATNWPEDKFDNYFIGYHEPEYYHIEVTSPNYRTTVFTPEKLSYDNVTLELKVLTASAKTSPTGDFRYGVAFRRSGDQYYAFTISPRAKKWFALKSSPSGLTVLTEGTDDDIHDVDKDDTLRVDLQDSNFLFYINDQFVGQTSDPDYTTGEVGLYVESFDSPKTHIHFDNLIIHKLEAPQIPQTGAAVLYQDDFTNPNSSWPEKKFDNYFIGYHEPEYYHIEITGPNYKTTVFEPQKRSFTDATIELDVLTAKAKTAATGDFRYGIAFRRSGDQYYAFTISPRTKKWYVLKNSPSKLEVLSEGTDDSIHDIDTDDTLRVDAQGSSFVFHINDKLIGQVTDTDYASGEVGFYVESFDSTATHIHFDKLTIRNFEVSVICNVNALTINVRSGPGTGFPSTSFLSNGQTVEPVGRSPDSQWILVKGEGGENVGWVFYSPGFLSCKPDVELLPVVQPQ